MTNERGGPVYAHLRQTIQPCFRQDAGALLSTPACYPCLAHLKADKTSPTQVLTLQAFWVLETVRPVMPPGKMSHWHERMHLKFLVCPSCGQWMLYVKVDADVKVDNGVQ